jgi:hypothetical protein
MIGRYRVALVAVFVAALLVGWLHAADVPGKDEEEREKQLKNLVRSAAQYTISSADDPKRSFKFHENAIIRFSTPVTGTKDGGIYLWSDRGRPQAIIKFYTYDHELYFHEFQSLSENAFSAERNGDAIWSPSGPGLEFRELSDAPKPAETAAERLRQMKSLAGKFSSTYTNKPEDKPVELRLLVQPVYRYEVMDDAKLLDGAIFGFAQGTTPMTLLLLEARRNSEGHRWHYAFARISSGSSKANYNEKEVFSVERYDYKRDPKQPFLILSKQPVPRE